MKISIIVFLFLILSCQKSKQVEWPATEAPSVHSFSSQIFEKKIIQDFFLILFRSDLNQESWNSLMSEVRKLNFNKNVIKKLSATEPSSPELNRLINENIQIILNLYETKAVYLLSWSKAENCSWSLFYDSPVLIEKKFTFLCSPRYDLYGENPLNGGLPQPIGDTQIVYKEKTGSLEKVPWISMRLKIEQENYILDKPVTMQLFLRENTENELFGEVLVDSNQKFNHEGQELTAYPYGIVQIKF